MNDNIEFDYTEWLLSRELAQVDPGDDGSEFNIESDYFRRMIHSDQ